MSGKAGRGLRPLLIWGACNTYCLATKGQIIMPQHLQGEKEEVDKVSSCVRASYFTVTTKAEKCDI